jgi:hypothetical protein
MKLKRCPKRTRRNKKTGLCESVASIADKKTRKGVNQNKGVKQDRLAAKLAIFEQAMQNLPIEADVDLVNYKNPLTAPLDNIIDPAAFALPTRPLFSSTVNKWLIEAKPKGDGFDLMRHQHLVREYLNLDTPYRGLLLYHLLGTGKSCTSIAVAEGMKHNKKIYLMIPASLETNYFDELKKCGDPLYKKKQSWKFISSVGKPEEFLQTLSDTLSLPVAAIQKARGAWMVSTSDGLEAGRPYESLNDKEKHDIDVQLTAMIRTKYKQINYNAGNLASTIRDLSKHNTVNPFSHSVVIIDETHKFISLIANKLIKRQTPDITEYAAIYLYYLLMSATNVRIVFLTGTPIVNYPNEMAILFNMLRGFIQTWRIPLRRPTQLVTLKDHFRDTNFEAYDQLELFSDGAGRHGFTITQNPFGFVNSYNKAGKYLGVRRSAAGEMTAKQFELQLLSILRYAQLDLAGEPTKSLVKPLPDIKEIFVDQYVDYSDPTNIRIKNETELKTRILGLTSYFANVDEKYLAPYIPSKHHPMYHFELTPMGEQQYTEYFALRKKELHTEVKASKIDELLGTGGSMFRISSRLACNFGFPKGIHRPRIHAAKLDDGMDDDNLIAPVDKVDYQGDKAQVMAYFRENKDRLFSLTSTDPNGLSTTSPKFRRILENIMNPANIGLHLLYSQFLEIEGLGLFKLVLEANGFAELKLKKVNRSWEIAPIRQEDFGKPRFVLYTGSESLEERGQLLHLFNGDWDLLSTGIRNQCQQISTNNMYGEVIKLFMITSAAAEGISLQNTRFVHLMEPFWHMVRLQQVIGRARRYRSHIGLPLDMQNVKVFMYLSTFDKGQSAPTEDDGRTSDQHIFEKAMIKYEIATKFQTAIKETAIDCAVFNGQSNCFSSS